MQIRKQLAALALSMVTKDRPLDAHIAAMADEAARYNQRRDRRRGYGRRDDPRTYVPMDVEDVA